MVYNAIRWNRIDVLNLLEQQGVVPNPKAIMMDCRHGDTAYWLHLRGYWFFVDVGIEISQNNLQFMKWLYAHRKIQAIRDLEAGIVDASLVNSAEMAR